MSFCVERGISHTEFLSWSAEDRAKTLAYILEEAERCTLCGTAPWEWEENPFAYEPTEKFCKGCYQKEVSSHGDQLPGTTIELAPVTELSLAKAQLRWREMSGMDLGDEQEG